MHCTACSEYKQLQLAAEYSSHSAHACCALYLLVCLQDIIGNFIYLIETYGFIPNGGPRPILASAALCSPLAEPAPAHATL